MIKQAPLFRLFKLHIKAEQRANFVAVGQQNLLTSIKQESGTLAMYTGHLDDAGVENRVLEVYRDQASYEIHANSAQFQAFKTVAGQAVVAQSVLALTPILLLEQGQGLRAVQPTTNVAYLTEMTAVSDQQLALEKLVSAEMTQAMATEPGLVVTYFGQVADEPQQFVRFEVYTSASAYRQSHQHSKLSEASQAMVSQQQTTEIKPDVFVTQGQLSFEAK